MPISVVIPAYNASATLERCLTSIASSTVQPLECLVVDDGSTDESAQIAASFGATVVATGGPYGPAHARNLGCRYAKGDILLFVDADVVLHSDAIEIFEQRFNERPELAAAIGTYDDSPADPSLVSRFKNLMHAYIHKSSKPGASTFWCGCGAVRRDIFFEHGGFDESYSRPMIEDIEFGVRLFQSGHSIALDSKIQCKHLKTWTLWKLVHTDIFQRGIPWTQLILKTGFMPNDLNLSWGQRLAAVLASLLPVMIALGIWRVFSLGVVSPPWEFVFGLVALLTIALVNRHFYAFLAARNGWGFAVRCVPLHILYYVYSMASLCLGVGSHVISEMRPPASARRPAIFGPDERL